MLLHHHDQACGSSRGTNEENSERKKARRVKEGKPAGLEALSDGGNHQVVSSASSREALHGERYFRVALTHQLTRLMGITLIVSAEPLLHAPNVTPRYTQGPGQQRHAW